MPPETMIELDQPRETDYQYEELFGSTEELPSSFVFLPKKIWNQGSELKTRMACSRYGIVHAINAMNEAVAQVDGMRTYEFDPEVMWLSALNLNPKAEFEGDTLQNAMDQMVKLHLITGYSRVYGEDQMKRSLFAHRPIYSGSKQCDWSSVRDNHLYALGGGYAHIFCIVGWDDKGFIAINSYGDLNGVFHVPYDLVGSLFSTYALSDKRDEEAFAKMK